MASSDPPYLTRWVMRIAASVVAALLIAKLVTEDSPSRLVHYDADGRTFSFEYPEFLAPIRSIETPTALIVSAGAEPGTLRTLAGKLAMILVMIEPIEFYRAAADPSPSTDTSFDDAKIISRNLPDCQDLPCTAFVSGPKDGGTAASFVYAGSGAVLFATGYFSEKQWKRHGEAIEKSFHSIKVNESAVRSFFAEDGWMTLTTAMKEGREVVDCRPSLWSPERLEAVGCKKLADYKTLGAVLFQCPEGEMQAKVRLIRDPLHCDQLQRKYDGKTSKLPDG